MPERLRPHLYLFTVNLIYAGNFTVAKLSMPEYIRPEAYIVIRAAIGALVFAIIHRLWFYEKVDAPDWPRLVLCGLFGVALNQALFFKGLALTSPINASLIMITVPIMVLVISGIVLRDKVTGRRVAGILAGLCGAAMIIVYGKDIRQLTVSTGDLFIFINATAYAIYLVLVKSLMHKYEAFTVIRWVFFFGFIMLFFTFGTDPIREVEWGNLPSFVWFSVIYVLIGTTIMAYMLNALSLKISSATLVSTYIYLQPLLATIIAISLGKDSLSIHKVTAGLLIFLGVFLVSFKPKVAVK